MICPMYSNDPKCPSCLLLICKSFLMVLIDAEMIPKSMDDAHRMRMSSMNVSNFLMGCICNDKGIGISG